MPVRAHFRNYVQLYRFTPLVTFYLLGIGRAWRVVSRVERVVSPQSFKDYC
jgi:hypothetical protein